MDDIGWCNHLAVTRGVCEMCGERVSGLTIEPLVIGLDLACENAALRKMVEEAETKLRDEAEKRAKAETIGLRNRQMYLSAADRADQADSDLRTLRKRVEELERERDSYRRDFDGTANAYEVLRAEFNALVTKAEKAERRVSELEAMQKEILQHDEIEMPVKDGSENLASVVHNALDALKDRAEKAERERDEAKQYTEEYKKAYLSELDELKEHMDKVSADHHALGNWPSCKHCTKFMNDGMEAQAITAQLQADLDAALLVIAASEVSLHQEAEYVGQPVVDACGHVQALLEKRRVERG